MAVAPPPRPIPGAFFVLTYDRDTQAYTMFVDDESHSSYNLGSDIQKVMTYFKIVGIPDLGNRAIDISHEFGAAQCIPGDERVFRVKSQPQRGAEKDMFADGPDRRGISLPEL